MTDCPAEARSRNIVLLSDGTGNAASRVWRSNVWRMFESLDLTSPDQVAIYDDGVGTSSFKPLALLGGGFGWGLKRNVLDLYTFLCRNYEPGAQIYAFGFSRGAFTIRVVLGFVANQGLVRHSLSGGSRLPESELQRLAKQAYRTYRAERFHSVLHVERLFRFVRNAFTKIADALLRRPRYEQAKNITRVPIHFVGLWDTVAAYGLPVEEMTRGISQWIWPLELPSRRFNQRDVRCARHALALDDERTTFHPVLWTESDVPRPAPDENGKRWIRQEKLSQVWFSGVHSNVGGGYPDDSLARVPLGWIMNEAKREGLRFKINPDSVLNATSGADPDGRLYDPRKGLGGYYRYGPRRIEDLCNVKLSRRDGDEVFVALPKIHESAFRRMKNGAHSYAPIGLPTRYAVVLENGQIVEGQENPCEVVELAGVRATAQERIWDLVWWRRIVYFATLLSSLHLVLFPLIYRTERAEEFTTPLRIVSETIRLVGSFLLGFGSWWIDSFAANPGKFVIGVAVLTGLLIAGVALGNKITDSMRTIWQSSFEQRLKLTGREKSGFVYKLRTNDAYRAVLWGAKRHVLPFLSAILIVYLGLTVINHVIFDARDAMGAYCREREKPVASVEYGAAQSASGFPTRDFCWSTGFRVQEGGRYRITVIEDPNAPWYDATIDSEARGFEVSEREDFSTRVVMTAAIPLRRALGRPWFRPIARIGTTGNDEYPLDPETAPAYNKPGSDRVVAEFKARRDGELFLYVNDAVFMWPIPHDLLYRNNKGTGTVCIERLGRPPSQPATRDAPAQNAVCAQNASDRSRPAAR